MKLLYNYITIVLLVVGSTFLVGCRKEESVSKPNIEIPDVNDINTVSLINEAKSLRIDLRDYPLMTDENKLQLYIRVQEEKNK